MPKKVLLNGTNPYECILKKGTNVRIEADFISRKTSKLTTKLSVRRGVFSKRIQVPQSNACLGLQNGANCPLQNGQEVKYVVDIMVPTKIPSAWGAVIFELIGDGGKSIVCGKLICKAVD